MTVEEKIVSLQQGTRHPSRLAKYDALEFATRQAQLAKTGGFHRIGIKFRAGGALTPFMIRKACEIVGGVEVRFEEPQIGQFAVEFIRVA